MRFLVEVFDELFNMTIAFDYNEMMSERTEYKYQIWFEITGYRLDDNNSYNNFAINMSNETMNLFTPIETIILDENVLNDLNLNEYTKKCFIFFSHFQPRMETFQGNNKYSRLRDSLTASVRTNVRSRVLTTSIIWMWSPIGMNGHKPWRSPFLVQLLLWNPNNCPIRPLDTLLLWVSFNSYRASVVYWVCGWVCT